MSDQQSKCQLFDDLWHTVYDDAYMWLVIWGKARTAKTTMAGWCLYSLYKDWNKVLDAFVYNLSQLLYNMKNGLPERWPTLNKLHNRVPALNWDDFGAHSNKATTQYDPAWDHFKGGFDVLGTKIGVLIATMVDPNEPTFQLSCKYTHEIEILKRGVYKYDQVEWRQDFKGWKPHIRKINVETSTFDPWPEWVYKEYDSTRQELADEVFQRIEDAQIEGHVAFTLRMSQPIDFQIMNTIRQRGPIYWDILHDLGPNSKQALVRLKSRQLLITLTNEKGSHHYDLTPLGLSVLEAHDLEQLAKQISNDGNLKSTLFAPVAKSD